MRNQALGSNASTVTSLFCNDHHSSQARLLPTSRLLKQVDITFQDKAYTSASKALEKYIEDYDKQQTIQLARVIAETCQTPVKQTNLLPEPSTLEKEIKLAQKLLPPSYSESVNSSSLATDELLAASSCVQHQTPNCHLLATKYADELSKLGSKQFGSTGLKLHQTCESPSTVSSSSLASRSDSSLSSYSRRKHSTRLRKTLQFSDDESASDIDFTLTSHKSRRQSHRSDSFEEILPTSSSYVPPSTCTRTSDFEEQMEDIEKTWRLVDDLKADLASTNNSTLRRHHPAKDSLVDLIRRLTLTARRKESALKRTMDVSLSQKRGKEVQSARSSSESQLKLSKSKVLSKDRHASLSASSSCSTHDEFSEDPYLSDVTSRDGVSDNPPFTHRSRAAGHVSSSTVTSEGGAGLERSRITSRDPEHKTAGIPRLYEHVSSRQDVDSTVLSEDNISEAMRLIDQRSSRQNIGKHHAFTPSKTPESVTLNAGRTPYATRDLHSLAGGDVSVVESSTDTDKILEGDRTWEKVPKRNRTSVSVDDDDQSSRITLSFHMEGKPEAVKDFMGDCLASSNGDCASLSGGNQPGSVEALKNMIFTLQGLTTSQRKERDESSGRGSDGQDSLQRALHHLDNLKSITQK